MYGVKHFVTGEMYGWSLRWVSYRLFDASGGAKEVCRLS